ncbi:MAG: phosphate acetyltransferase [Omnitrophica WOR_2 bacterium RBG_13_41_10]|nr:MAG: phosphate acetyltransferase [Omnitrophica WOR_2 bacterium RBG_13_41_10]
MDVTRKIYAKAKANPKTIVLPEYKDERVVQAYHFVQKEGIANVILLTEDKILPQEKERYIQEFCEMRKAKGMDIESARKIFEDPLYYAAMMTREGKADGFVAGASHTTSDVARAAIHCLGVDERINIACSCFIMDVPNCIYGENGVFFFADCGIVPEPNPRQLACIALTSAELAIKVLDFVPRIALLSYSTHGSAKGKYVEEIKEALKILREMSPHIIADGELQVDAAIVPEVAQIKYPDSILGGKANVLIFPNLEAGNISYKLVQRLANARAIGPLILGLNKPCSDLSRGCSAEDVIDCVAVTAIRAQ